MIKDIKLYRIKKKNIPDKIQKKELDTKYFQKVNPKKCKIQQC